MRTLRARGTVTRPAWTIRGLVGGMSGEGTWSFEIPAGRAGTPEEALSIARTERPLLMGALPAESWRAFPVVGPRPDPSAAFEQGRQAG